MYISSGGEAGDNVAYSSILFTQSCILSRCIKPKFAMVCITTLTLTEFLVGRCNVQVMLV